MATANALPELLIWGIYIQGASLYWGGAKLFYEGGRYEAEWCRKETLREMPIQIRASGDTGQSMPTVYAEWLQCLWVVTENAVSGERAKEQG